MTESPPDDCRRPDGPRRRPGTCRSRSPTRSTCAAVVDLLGRDRLRRDVGVRPARRGRQDGARRWPTRSRWPRMAVDRVRALRAAAPAARPSSAPTRSRRWRRSQAPFDAFHARTAPSDWLEGLIKAYVGDGLAADFYREIAAFLDADTRTIIVESLADAGQSRFVVDRVRAAIEAGPAGRRPARAVGPPADGRGAVPGPAGRRRAGRADRAARRRRRPARAWTWPRSGGCSPG